MIGVVDHRDQQRRREQHRGERGGGALDGERRQPVAGQAAAAPREPQHGEQRVDVGDLGEAGAVGQGSGDHDQPPAAPPALGGGGVGVFDAEQQQRQEGDGVDGGVGEPGKGAVEAEGDPRGDRRRPGEREPSQQGVGGQPRDQLEQDVLPDLPVAERGQQRRRKERGRLHPARERHPGPLEGVPPRELEMEQVERRAVAHRLGDEAVVGVDRRLAAGRPESLGHDEAAPRAEWVDVGDPEQIGQVGRDHDRGDDDHRPGVRRHGARPLAPRRGPATRRGRTGADLRHACQLAAIAAGWPPAEGPWNGAGGTARSTGTGDAATRRLCSRRAARSSGSAARRPRTCAGRRP